MKRISTVLTILFAGLLMTACTKCSQQPPVEPPPVVEPAPDMPPTEDATMPGDTTGTSTETPAE